MNTIRGPGRVQAITLFGFVVLAVAALRAILFFRGQPPLLPAIWLLAGYGLVFAASPWLFSRSQGLRWLYFLLQAGLALAVSNLRPFLDVSVILYIPLFLQALHAFGRRVAVAWIAAFAVCISATLVVGKGWAAGMAFNLMILGGCAFLISYDLLSAQTQADEAEGQVLLAELQQAHRALQAYAAQAEVLAAARERNRLARELHASVREDISGITLTSQAARQLLERDPARVAEELDRLQEMTAGALGQLRSVISQLRLPPGG